MLLVSKKRNQISSSLNATRSSVLIEQLLPDEFNFCNRLMRSSSCSGSYLLLSDDSDGIKLRFCALHFLMQNMISTSTITQIDTAAAIFSTNSSMSSLLSSGDSGSGLKIGMTF